MYDLETVKATLQIKLKELTDPYDTSNNPEPVLVNVMRGEPDLISLFDGTLAGLVFIHSTEQQLGLNKHVPINAAINNMKGKSQSWIMNLVGGVVLFVPGNDDDSDTIATQLSDVVSDFFKDSDCLELPGVSTSPLTSGASMNWRPLTITLENQQKPIKSLTAAIKFNIEINDNLKH